MPDEVYENRPKSLQELRNTSYELPHVPGFRRPSLKMTWEIRSYAKCETAGDSVKDLKFVRSASIDGVSYYLWELPSEGEFVLAENYDGSWLYSLGSRDDLTTEQLLVREYLANQWQLKLPEK